MKAKIFLSLFSIVVVSGVLELCLRLFYVGGAEQTPEFAMSEQTGWVRAPNQSGFVYQRNPGIFKTRFRTNSRGMRDAEYSLDKRSNLRILVLGDSFTEGWGVEEQQAYPKVLENQFLQGVEVWNLGVVGFGTDQELQQLRQLIAEARPDIVVLGFYENDIADNTRAQSLWYPRFRKPLFTVREEQLVLTNAQELASQKIAEQKHITSMKHRVSGPLMQSAMIRLIRFAIGKAWYSMHMASGAMELQHMVWERDNTYRTEETPEMKEAWSITERLLGEINSLCRRNEAKFVLAYIPRAIEVVPGLLQLEQEKLGVSEPAFVFDLTRAEKRLAEIAQRGGIPFVAMGDSFRRTVSESLYLIPIMQDGHLSALGQSLVARTLAEYLYQGRLVPPKNFRKNSL